MIRRAQILCASYGQELAVQAQPRLPRADDEPLLQTFVRRRALSAKKAAMDEFETTAHGFRLATSVGGVLTGRGADCSS